MTPLPASTDPSPHEVVFSLVSPSFLSSCAAFISMHSGWPSETHRFGDSGKECFYNLLHLQPAWPDSNIFIDTPRLCLSSREKKEHMVYHLTLETIPSLSKRGKTFPSFQSINYSSFIVFDYIHELLQIKLDRIFRGIVWFHLSFLTAWRWFQAPFWSARISSSYQKNCFFFL